MTFPLSPGADRELQYTRGKPNWLPWCAAEHRATRSDVAVFDQTSFGKLLIKGDDAQDLLQLLCTADLAVEPGRTTYTGMLNTRGGYEADVTVTRVGYDEYLLVTSAGSPVRDREWIMRHAGRGQHVSVTDVTTAYAVYGVMGPQSRELLQRLTRADLSDSAFPFSTSKQIDLGHATVRATRITYVGELGWELYVPVEFGVGVYEELQAAGADLGIVNAGYYAINSLRLEKGYRAFGSDLTPDHAPIEAGLQFACKLRTSVDFIGRAAVENARRDGVRRKLASFVLRDPEVMLWGGELILHDGEPAGQVTSAAWGESLGACVALGYVQGVPATADHVKSGNYQLSIGGALADASVHLRPPYDPAGEKIKS